MFKLTFVYEDSGTANWEVQDIDDYNMMLLWLWNTIDNLSGAYLYYSVAGLPLESYWNKETLKEIVKNSEV